MIPFLVGLGLVIGGTLLVKYWKNIVDWLKDFIPKLKMAWKRVRPMLPYAAIIVGDKLWEAGSALVAVMHRLLLQGKRGMDRADDDAEGRRK